MSFQAFESYFEPEVVKDLGAAYDAAWQELWVERLTLPPDQIPILKRRLAQLILASACSGKRNVNELKEILLRGAPRRYPSPKSDLKSMQAAMKLHGSREPRMISAYWGRKCG